jgi:tRNA uridine 5-carboxymethylaminomethyl modification enzyme
VSPVPSPVRLKYDVIVIGGGHAGVEAAWAAANLLGPNSTQDSGLGCVALVSLDPSKIGVMSCNPAIGGLAKGQIVREIDALGGLMGLATDATGIQFKVLNTSKGPAVHGPRAQCDKHAYAEAVQILIRSRHEIDVIAGSCERFIVRDGAVVGAVIATPSGPVELQAGAVVLTTGTFMRGLMHSGEEKTPGGRFGEAPAVGVSAALRELGFELGRLKTGTPPRLRKSSIRWEELTPQFGDAEPTPFSDLTGTTLGTHATPAQSSAAWLGEAVPLHSTPSIVSDEGTSITRHALANWANGNFVFDRFPLIPQLECRMSQTGPAAHEAIRANLHRAPMFSGQIESAGPRYCPSIEDKVVRFAQRETHGVFLEPESHRDDWIYCNGISTSLPHDVQDAIVRSMPGCENAEIYRYGYAVEYDMVPPHQITPGGRTKRVGGLYLAGQINGTSGYEEAAAQGLIAGINAARWVRGQPEFILGREQAYIGVLMDDLATKTPVEPYRMFTSRAEHRLLLRSDNAPERLTPLAIELGLLDATGDRGLGARRKSMFDTRTATIAQLHRLGRTVRLHGKKLADLAREPEVDEAQLLATLRREWEAARAVVEPTIKIDSVVYASAARSVFADWRYEPFIIRQRAEIERQRDMEHRPLPERVDYAQVGQLRNEARTALSKFRPTTFGQAGRLEGITPADLTLLSVLLKKWHDAGGPPTLAGGEPRAQGSLHS